MPRYYIYEEENDSVSGPFTMEDLRTFAEWERFSAKTRVAEEGSEEWQLATDSPEIRSAVLEAPREKKRPPASNRSPFGTRRFKSVNDEDDSAGVDVKALLDSNRRSQTNSSGTRSPSGASPFLGSCCCSQCFSPSPSR